MDVKKTNRRIDPARDMRSGVAALCAAFMLCALPLLYHDALFDINRFKVAAVRAVVPAVCVLMAFAHLIGGARRADSPLIGRRIAGPCLLAALFALSCVVSCALRGFEHAVLDGSEGRYCGLFFLLSCIAAFFIIALWLQRGDALCLTAVVCAALCALLGFANMAGLDPLGFYREMSAEQRPLFVSTIGHVDFFGTYLAMMFAMAGGQALFGKTARARALAVCCALIIALGAAASRTDSAVLGMLLACAVLFALSGDSLSRMGLTLMLAASVFFSLPIMRMAAEASRFGIEVSGLPLALCRSGVAVFAGVVSLSLGALCLLLKRRGAHAPGRRRTASFVVIALILLTALLLGTIVYFTCVNPQADLGAAASFLRFDDAWGTLRGFVYKRALRAYRDFSLTDKLFGGGLDLTERILTPYFDDPSMLVGGVFNDAHCQPLQMLLTCGVFGFVSFTGFYLSMLWQLARHAGEDPVLCGALAMLGAYAVIMLINVTQPILMATYFSICALAASRLRRQ